MSRDFKALCAAAAFIAASCSSASAATDYVYGTSVETGASYIGYYIPLDDSAATCTYAVDCGTSSDSRNTSGSGSVMSMDLSFDLPDYPVFATLKVWFRDLDLLGVNDPNGFSEAFKVTGYSDWITEASDPAVISANYDEQWLGFDLGILSGGTTTLTFLFQSTLELKCTVKYSYHTKSTQEYCPTFYNTIEKLKAKIHYEEVPNEVPLPAGLPLLLGAVGALGFVRNRKRR